MNKIGALQIHTYIFGFIVVTVFLSGIILAVNEVSTNYGISMDGTYAENLQDINESLGDVINLKGDFTDEAEQTQGGIENVDDEFSATFEGAKITTKTYSIVQDVIPSFSKMMNFMPNYVWGILSFVIIMIGVFALFSFLRGNG